MTDTEAKALALVNAHAINRRSDLDDAKHTELRCALLDAVQSQAATEARHAAELREQAERFSVVAAKVSRRLKQSPDANVNWMADLLTPFILPASDPLVEYLVDVEGYFPRVAKEFADRLRLATREGKIVWEAGE